MGGGGGGGLVCVVKEINTLPWFQIIRNDQYFFINKTRITFYVYGPIKNVMKLCLLSVKTSFY